MDQEAVAKRHPAEAQRRSGPAPLPGVEPFAAEARSSPGSPEHLLGDVEEEARPPARRPRPRPLVGAVHERRRLGQGISRCGQKP